jgi:hypothetical protein
MRWRTISPGDTLPARTLVQLGKPWQSTQATARHVEARGRSGLASQIATSWRMSAPNRLHWLQRA